MAKKVQIEFDIDNRDVKLTSDGILTLTEQIKVLRKELLRTEEGTAKFDILSQKLNQTKDDLARVNTKNRELFATFSFEMRVGIEESATTANVLGIAVMVLLMMSGASLFVDLSFGTGPAVEAATSFVIVGAVAFV